MGRVVANTSTSLDGFVEDRSRMPDPTKGRSGRHPAGAPVFVGTHSPPDDVVADVIERAQEAAAGRSGPARPAGLDRP